MLDGYAGTGAIGIEAMSRGAASVVFVERDPRAATLVEANLAHCGITNGCVMMRGDFEGACAGCPHISASILFCWIPPTMKRRWTVRWDRGKATVRADCWWSEHATRRRAPDRVGALCCVRRVKSGASTLSLYRLAAGVSDEETRLGATANQPDGLEES